VVTPPLQMSSRAVPEVRPSPVLTPIPAIRVSRSQGSGPTRLAAFDAALVAAGLQNFNLLPLSSVIPVGASVEVVGPGDQLQGVHGDLLYCVYAAAYATVPGTQAWAGIAWGLRDDESGAGLFVEHSGPTEHAVVADLHATLGDMMAKRPDRYVEGGRLVSSATCQDEPVAALVVASYQAVGWSGTGPGPLR
jgi:arginine decarboxylase